MMCLDRSNANKYFRRITIGPGKYWVQTIYPGLHLNEYIDGLSGRYTTIQKSSKFQAQHNISSKLDKCRKNEATFSRKNKRGFLTIDSERNNLLFETHDTINYPGRRIKPQRVVIDYSKKQDEETKQQVLLPSPRSALSD